MVWAWHLRLMQNLQSPWLAELPEYRYCIQKSVAVETMRSTRAATPQSVPPPAKVYSIVHEPGEVLSSWTFSACSGKREQSGGRCMHQAKYPPVSITCSWWQSYISTSTFQSAVGRTLSQFSLCKSGTLVIVGWGGHDRNHSASWMCYRPKSEVSMMAPLSCCKHAAPLQMCNQGLGAALFQTGWNALIAYFIVIRTLNPQEDTSYIL